MHQRISESFVIMLLIVVESFGDYNGARTMSGEVSVRSARFTNIASKRWPRIMY